MYVRWRRLKSYKFIELLFEIMVGNGTEVFDHSCKVDNPDWVVCGVEWFHEWVSTRIVLERESGLCAQSMVTILGSTVDNIEGNHLMSTSIDTLIRKEMFI